MKVTIHQPEHLVWLGFLDKIAQADLYIILDSVQFSKNNFQNRNKIRTAKGWTWVTVPVEQHPLVTPINNIKIAQHLLWQKKYLGGIAEVYRRTKYFDDVFPALSQIVSAPHKTVVELNMELLKFLFLMFDIRTPYVFSSDMTASKSGVASSELILSLCKEVDATMYLSGSGGRSYLDNVAFEKAGIGLSFQCFQHPIYTQAFEPFVVGMSSIDLLFNYGKEGAQQILFHNF